MHAFEYFQGIPALVVPDSFKTGVTRAYRYRLKPGKPELEFYRAEVILTSEDVCREALEEFLFEPFPLAVIGDAIS